MPPCAGAPQPDAAAVGASLNQRVWVDDDVIAAWVPPACTGWSPGPTKALIAAAGRFRISGNSDELAARLARVSMLADMVYWSSTRSRWRHLFEEAVALATPDRDDERADFAADDLVPGAELYYWLQEDNPTAGVVYQMVIHERTPDRLVFENVNRTDIRAKFLFIKPKIAEPEEFRQLYYIEREAGEIWRYYSLVRMGRASTLAGTSAANYRNRAEAYFRFLAGLRMDREPPAAR